MSGIDRTHNYSAQQIVQQTPQKSGWSKAGEFLGSMAKSATSGVPFLGNVFSQVGVASGQDAGFNKQYELILLQQQIQQQMQTFSTMSNISKSKHEAAMSAVRNIK